MGQFIEQRAPRMVSNRAAISPVHRLGRARRHRAAADAWLEPTAPRRLRPALPKRAMSYWAPISSHGATAPTRPWTPISARPSTCSAPPAPQPLITQKKVVPKSDYIHHGINIYHF